MKTAFVTGAGNGIGKAIAKRLENDGYNVLKAEHRTDLDLRDSDAVFSYAEKTIRTFGCPDVIVNCAGISSFRQIQDISPDEWDDMLDSNLTSVYLVCKAFSSAMISKHSGCIINITSMWGQTGASMESHYSASKGGIIAFSKALAKELGPSGIRVNCVAPGVIKTRMLDALDEDALKELADETPLGRLGTPEDVAGAVSFLAGDDASFITGQVLGVNGGFVI